MRLSALVLALGTVFLVATGIRPGALPFIPNTAFSDAVISHFPAVLFLRESVLERGEFPVWRDLLMAGEPFAANPLNKTAYPFQWLALVFPPVLFLDLMIVLHLLLAGWGMWRWARALGLREEAAALSALAFALAPRVVAHTGAGHLDLLYGLAWWVWLMGAVREAVNGGNGSQSTSLLALSRHLHIALKLSVFGALVFLADVRLGLFAFGSAGVYALYELWRAGAWRRVTAFALAAPVLVLLTASVTAPLVMWRPYLSRSELTSQGAGLYSLEAWQLAGLLPVPLSSGVHEMLTYIGFPVLALAVIGVVAQPRRLALWVGLIAAATLYALGSNGFFWTALVRAIPFLLWFRVPSRAWLIVAVIAPLLAGYGLQTLMDWLRKPPQKALQRARLAALALLAVSLAGGAMLLTMPLPKSVGTGVLIGGGLLAGALLLALARRLAPGSVAILLILVTFADLTWTGLQWLTWRGEAMWFSPYTALAERLAEEQPARILAPIYEPNAQPVVSLPQEVAAVYGLRLFGGVDPFQISGIVRAIEQGSGIRSSAYDVIMPPVAKFDGGEPPVFQPDTQTLAQWDVSHVVSAYPIENPRLRLLDRVGDRYIYTNLDYGPDSDASRATGWVDGWAGLPDMAAVREMNRTTILAASVSAVSFAVCVAALAFLKLRGMA